MRGQRAAAGRQRRLPQPAGRQRSLVADVIPARMGTHAQPGYLEHVEAPGGGPHKVVVQVEQEPIRAVPGLGRPKGKEGRSAKALSQDPKEAARQLSFRERAAAALKAGGSVQKKCKFAGGRKSRLIG